MFSWRVEALDQRGRDILPKGTTLIVDAETVEEATTKANESVKAETLYRPSYILVYRASEEDLTLV